MSADRVLLYRDGDDLPALIEKANNLPGSVILNPAEGFEGEFIVLSLHQFQILPTSVGWILVLLAELVRSDRYNQGIEISYDTDTAPPVEYMQLAVEAAMRDGVKKEKGKEK